MCFCNVLGPSAVGKSMSHVSCLQVAMIVYGTTVGFASYLLAAKSEETQNSVLCAWHCWDGRELWSLQTGLKLLQPLYFIDSWQRMPTDFPVPFGPFCVGSIAQSGCAQLFIAHVCVLSNVLMGFPLFSLLSWYFLSIKF